MPRPPLDLAVAVTAADGTQHRWGPEKHAGSVPQGLSFKTKQSEGFADASLTLSRRIDREYVDLHLLDSVVISGAGGSIAYEGRVAALPRSMQQTHQVTVQAVGWMAHTRDRKMQEIYVDRDLSRWGAASINRRVASSSFSFTDPSQVQDPNALLPAIETQITAPWSINFTPASESWYDAGPGLAIGSVYYEWTKHANVDASDSQYHWRIMASSVDDSFGSADTSGELRAAGPGSGTLDTTATDRRWAIVQFYDSADNPSGIAGKPFGVWWENLAVYGTHGLTLIGSTNPKGVAASDAIKHLIGKYCPKLNTSGVQATTYPIPHLVFTDRTDPYEALLEVNKYHLWQLAVYENRTLNFGPVDMSDYDWEVRLSDLGTTVDLQGDSTDTLANGIVVTYQDVNTGNQNVLTPDAHSELKDPSDSNPATLAGLTKWTEISLSSPSTQDAALQVGRAALAEFNQPKSPGTITVQGHIRDRAGHWQPAWKVRNGDRIVISDHPNDRPRLVVETDYTHDNKTVSIAVDSTFKRLDAVLDRLGTALRSANLAS